MILRNRPFERVAPARDAKSIYIFCEGAKRELAYFNYFKEIDSRINIEVYGLHPHEDNSPLGLLHIAEKCILKSEKNPVPKYNFIEGDEVWIVLDIDEDKHKSREPQIATVLEKCNTNSAWNLAQSNPCFEVWLYYHVNSKKPFFENYNKCSEWKKFVNKSVSGGFDSRKHPILIENASLNAQNNFRLENDRLNIGSTDLFRLANAIIPLIKDKISIEYKNS